MLICPHKNVFFLARYLSLFFGLALSAVSHAATPNLADLCQRPVEVICGPHAVKKSTREERTELLQEQVRQVAWDEVLKIQPDAKWEEVPFGVPVARELTARQKRLATLYFSAVNAQLKKMFGDSFSQHAPQFDQVRDFLMRTFKERLNGIRPADVIQMNQILDRSNVKFIDGLEVLSPNSNADAELLSSVVEMCGPDGLTDNAFANKTETLNYVVVCAGNYLGGYDPRKKKANSPGEDFEDEIWILGHELGHHIDARYFPHAYEKLESCLAENYMDGLGEVDERGNREKLIPSDISRYMSEISADYWGVEMLADVLKSIKSPRQKIARVQDNLAFLCGTVDDGSTGGHPDGKFRIENLVRRNPRFSATLGCPSPAAGTTTKPSCTLRGAWADKFW